MRAVSDEVVPHLFDVLAAVRTVARERGYAVAVHGSLARDIDLVAVPWGDIVSPPADLVAGIITATGWLLPDPAPTEKHHGRLVWVIRLPKMITTAYLDFSVMQPHRCIDCFQRRAGSDAAE